MKRLIEIPLEEGTSMLVEVEESRQEGSERVSRGEIFERHAKA